MKSFSSLFVPLCALICLGAASTPAHATGNVNVSIYSGIGSPSGDGSPFTNQVDSFTAPDVAFGSDNGWNWFPESGLTTFGSDITGSLNVPVSGLYTFGLESDDGSSLTLDGNQIVSNTGAHSPVTVFSSPINLTSGAMNPFDIHYYESFGPPAGVDLLWTTPTNSDPVLVPSSAFVVCDTPTAAVPEPSSIALLGMGGLPLLGLLRRRLF